MYNYKEMARSVIRQMTEIRDTTERDGGKDVDIEVQLAVLLTRMLNLQGMSEMFGEALISELGAFSRAFHTYCIYPFNQRLFSETVSAELTTYLNWHENNFILPPENRNLKTVDGLNINSESMEIFKEAAEIIRQNTINTRKVTLTNPEGELSVYLSREEAESFAEDFDGKPLSINTPLELILAVLSVRLLRKYLRVTDISMFQLKLASAINERRVFDYEAFVDYWKKATEIANMVERGGVDRIKWDNDDSSGDNSRVSSIVGDALYNNATAKLPEVANYVSKLNAFIKQRLTVKPEVINDQPTE